MHSSVRFALTCACTLLCTLLSVNITAQPKPAVNYQSGNLEIIAVSGATRMASIPDVPTVAESGVPGFETGSWQGVLAPAGTPADIVMKLNAELARILNSSDMKEKLAAQGAEARTNSAEVFGGFISKEKERWAKVVKGAGIKIE